MTTGSATGARGSGGSTLPFRTVFRPDGAPTPRPFAVRRAPRGGGRRSCGAARSSRATRRRLSRHRGGVEKPVTPPAPRDQPVSRARHRTRSGSPAGLVGIRRHLAPPSIEPTRRGRGVERHARSASRGVRLGGVPACIQQHVPERMVHLARRREQSCMIAIGEHRARPPRRSIERSSEPRTDRHHPAAERATIVGFDDQVRVIPLQRVLDQAEAATRAAARERARDLAHDRHRPQRRQAGAEPEGHVRRTLSETSHETRDGAPPSRPWVVAPPPRAFRPTCAALRAPAATDVDPSP